MSKSRLENGMLQTSSEINCKDERNNNILCSTYSIDPSDEAPAGLRKSLLAIAAQILCLLESHNENDEHQCSGIHPCTPIDGEAETNEA